MLGGMITYVLLTRLGCPHRCPLPRRVAVVAVVGVIIERLVVRPLWERNAACSS